MEMVTYARLGVAGADLSIQYAMNIGKGYGFLGKYIDINITSVLANGAMPGSAMGASIIGNGFYLSYNGYLRISAAANGNTLAGNILLGYGGTVIGSGLSRLAGNYINVGAFWNNYTGNVLGNYVGNGGQFIWEN